MCLLVFLLGSVALAVSTENVTSDPGIYISHSKMLVTVASPSIDLDLSGLDIRYLNPLAFGHGASVRTLDLSNNWINELSPGIFSSMPKLERLSLAYNELKSKSMSGAFRNLTNLKSLDLTHNPLSKILNNEMFVGLPNTCEIHIRGSKHLRTITPAAFRRTKMPAAKNHTKAGESKNCTLRLSDVQEMFDRAKIKLQDLIYWDNVVKMCTDNTILRFIDFSNVTHTQSSNCNDILLSEDKTMVNMDEVSISSFDNGWFRMRNTSVSAIYITGTLYYVPINMTSDVLNDLPESIKVFSLTRTEMTRLNKGVMFNEHLRDLSLRENWLKFIEADAFEGLKLTRLDVGDNPLLSLDYVPTLPRTLLWLNADSASVREIPANTFANMRNLLVLSLARTGIRGLRSPALDGLVSLRWLDVNFGKIKYLRQGVFRDLSQLHSLNLSMNNIARFDIGSFNGLGCLAKLDLRSNRLESLAGGVFDGLTDSLETLDLSENNLVSLEAGTFVDAPKFNLSLQENNIRKIDKDTFDLPYLMNLDLRYNDLTTIEAGAAKRLGSLADKTDIKLGFNPIERLDNGALAGLSSKARVNLGMTPIKVIQSGVFDDLSIDE